MRDYMERRVTSPAWGLPPPCDRKSGCVDGLLQVSIISVHSGSKNSMWDMHVSKKNCNRADLLLI